MMHSFLKAYSFPLKVLSKMKKINHLSSFQKSCSSFNFSTLAASSESDEKQIASLRVMSLLQDGETFLHHCKYSECQKRYEEALNISENDLGPKSREKGLSLNCLAQLHHLKGNLFEALELYNQSFTALSEDYKLNRLLLASIENNLSVVYQSFQDYEAGVSHLQKAAEMLDLDVKPELDQKVEIFCRIGAIRMSQGNWNEAKKYFLKVVSLVEFNPGVSIKDTNLGKIQLELADILEKEGDLQSAFTNRQKAVNLLGSHPGCSTLLIPVYESILDYSYQNNLGSEQIIQNCSALVNALMITPRVGDKIKIPRVLIKMADAHFSRKDFENAQKIYMDAFNYYNNSSDATLTSSELVLLYSSLAKSFQGLGLNKEATDWLNKAVEMHENSKEKDTLEIAEIYKLLAEIHQNLSKKAKAVKYSKKAIKIYQTLPKTPKNEIDALQSLVESSEKN